MNLFKRIAGQATPGTLYGIGVGPGDPRLLTLRAAGLVTTVDVLAYFHKQGRTSIARRIVEPLIETAREELALTYAVTTEAPVTSPAYIEATRQLYQHAADEIAEHLRRGRSVGLLAEGDPFFYGSFMHIWQRLAERHDVEVVPGVTGMAACWGRAGVPITWGDDVLTVLPGTLGEPTLVERLRTTDAAVIMKLGRHLAKVTRALDAAGRLVDAIYVERATTADERIERLRDWQDRAGDGAVAPYFSMVLVPGCGRRI